MTLLPLEKQLAMDGSHGAATRLDDSQMQGHTIFTQSPFHDTDASDSARTFWLLIEGCWYQRLLVSEVAGDKIITSRKLGQVAALSAVAKNVALRNSRDPAGRQNSAHTMNSSRKGCNIGCKLPILDPCNMHNMPQRHKHHTGLLNASSSRFPNIDAVHRPCL